MDNESSVVDKKRFLSMMTMKICFYDRQKNKEGAKRGCVIVIVVCVNCRNSIKNYL